MKNAKWLNSGITGQVEHLTGGSYCSFIIYITYSYKLILAILLA
ncbi:MAG: hypothetical protein NT007_07075 [Candidatus Kapabacteria bacterium]|nr:hypothetical protein [Candidatus Kapabacteria bacterium]